MLFFRWILNQFIYFLFCYFYLRILLIINLLIPIRFILIYIKVFIINLFKILAVFLITINLNDTIFQTQS